jgi:histidinol-phosphate aminotransferase
VGYAVANPDLIGALRKVALPFAVNYLAQAAAVASLTAGDELAARCAAVAVERSRVLAHLRSAGYQVPDSQANFVWLPLRDRAADFAAHCEEHRVIVRPFADATGGVRVTIGAPDENDAFVAAATSWPGLAG